MANHECAPQETTHWKENTTASASAAVFLNDSEGRLLMVQDIDEYGGKWSPIAGFVDVAKNEEPEMAALREVKEELGLDVRLDELLGVWHYYPEDAPKKNDEASHMHVGYAYTGTILGGTYQMQKEEIQNFGFFTPEDVEHLHAHGMLKTPQYNYMGFKLWQKGTRHPLNVIVTNGKLR
jgi:ADP-ribose pyrophosphatase YjhB (NUDIX family)